MTSPAPRPRSTSSPRAHRHRSADSDGLPVAREVVLHAHFDAATGRRARPCSGRPAARGGPAPAPARAAPVTGAATPAPRSPSSPSSTSTRSSPRPATPSRTGSASPSSSATAPASSRAAPDPRAAATSTTSSPTTTTANAEGRPQPGPTGTDNLAALCRFHHRLKTHTAWRYRDDRARSLRVDQPPRPPLPPRPHRHHRPDPPEPHRPIHDPAAMHPAAVPPDAGRTHVRMEQAANTLLRRRPGADSMLRAGSPCRSYGHHLIAVRPSSCAVRAHGEPCPDVLATSSRHCRGRIRLASRGPHAGEPS